MECSCDMHGHSIYFLHQKKAERAFSKPLVLALCVQKGLSHHHSLDNLHVFEWAVVVVARCFLYLLYNVHAL